MRALGRRHRVEHVDPERTGFGGRRGTHVHVGVVDGERRIRRPRSPRPTAGQVRRLHGAHPRHGAARAEHHHALALELLIEQRSGRCAHAPQGEIAVGCDVTDHVPHLVERAGYETLRRPLAEADGHVAGPVARTPRNQREQRIGHRLLEPGDGGHAGEPDRQAIDAGLSGQADGRIDG